MPQQYYNPETGEPIQQEYYNPETGEPIQKRPEPTWTQSITGGFLGIAPAVIGGIAGAPGGIPGMIAGGAAGAGLGSTLRQDFEVKQGLRDKINPYVVGAETLLGAVPGFSKFPGFSSGARELLKYGVKAGAEGAAL